MKKTCSKLITACLLISSFIFLFGVIACNLPSTCLISGTVDGDIQEGVKLILSGPISDNATTDADGTYIFEGLDNGTYTITPSYIGYTFDPASRTINITVDSETGVNFTSIIIPDAYTLSGSITGDILEGITITLSGNAATTVTTDASGDFSIEGLDNGTYTITPSLSGYVFTPASQSVTIEGFDEADVDFTAAKTYTISGTVSGDTKSGVSVKLTGAATNTISTDSNGNYSFSGLLNGSYTVKPSKSSYTFSPTSRSVSVSGANKTGEDFTATEVITVERFTDNGDGTVTDNLTDLIWLKNANCYSDQNWGDAMTSAAGLNHGECGLSDGSEEGEWRLPTIEELQGIGTDPPATWDAGGPSVTWTMPGSPFISVQSDYYWSSTEYDTFNSWYVRMDNGFANGTNITTLFNVWPVRSDN